MTLKITVWDYFSFVPLFYLAFILLQVRHPFFRWLFLSAIALISLIEVFKYASKSWLVTYPILARPQGAFNCNCLNRGGSSAGDPGFPSGHVALICFVLISMFIHGLRTETHPVLISIWGLYAMIQVYFVAQSRLKKNCHNLPQVMTGGALGISCAMLFALVAPS